MKTLVIVLVVLTFTVIVGTAPPASIDDTPDKATVIVDDPTPF